MRLTLLLALLLSGGLQAACDLDAGFGSGGYVTFSDPAGGSNALGYDLVALSDGRLLIAGAAELPSSHREATCWTADANGGSQSGASFADVAGGTDGEFFAAAEAPDGSAVVLGGYVLDGSGNTCGALLRLSLPGASSPDSGFGIAGWVTFSASSPVRGLVVDAGNRVYSVDDAGLKRWSSAGVLDNSWGSGGNLSYDVAGSAQDLQMDPAGRLVLGGLNSTGLAVWRVLTSGGMDPAFGTSGRVQRSVGGALHNASVQSLSLDAGGAILATGGDFNLSTLKANWLAWSLDSAGAPVSGFGSSGLAQGVTVSGLSGDQWAEGAIANGSAWLLPGRHPNGLYDTPSLWALQSNGALDTSYGTGGQRLPISQPGAMRRPRVQGAYAYATGSLGSSTVLWRFSSCAAATPTPSPSPTLTPSASPTPGASTTALASLASGKSMAYPNPAKGKVFIAVQPPDSGLHLAIYDELGRQITEADNAYAPTGVWEIDIRGYAPGVYYYAFRGGSSSPPPGKFAVLP
jgi:uncharacterized delta-60 repeat protein